MSLIIQVGLPATSDAYTHRVGRTARAGKSGRAIIMLTQPESYFLKVNPQFPIRPYPASKQIIEDHASASAVQQAMQSINDKTKHRAYQAYLGFMTSFTKKLNTDSAGLVQIANAFAIQGMGCPEPPALEKKTVGYFVIRAASLARFANLSSAKWG